jgi:hypothetical protein
MTMNINTAAQIVKGILTNAPKDFYEKEALGRAQQNGNWAEAKALEMIADLSPKERAVALGFLEERPSAFIDAYPDAPVDFTPMKGDPKDLHYSGKIFTSVEDDPQYRMVMDFTPDDRL